jgi:methylated-DNA-[protein]-cysteine S-methyltransferase
MTVQTFQSERIDTPTGRMLLVSDDEHRLRALDWEDHEPRMRKLLLRHYGANAIRLREVSRPSAARRAIEAYFDGELDALDGLPTSTNGTDFQRAVWAALRRIPVGRTISYGALAAKIGRPTATRAVGLANGANPIAIVVPCHRVIGANATLTGYGGGLERKRWLLAHEAACRGGRSQP